MGRLTPLFNLRLGTLPMDYKRIVQRIRAIFWPGRYPKSCYWSLGAQDYFTDVNLRKGKVEDGCNMRPGDRMSYSLSAVLSNPSSLQEKRIRMRERVALQSCFKAEHILCAESPADLGS